MSQETTISLSKKKFEFLIACAESQLQAMWSCFTDKYHANMELIAEILFADMIIKELKAWSSLLEK